MPARGTTENENILPSKTSEVFCQVIFWKKCTGGSQFIHKGRSGGLFLLFLGHLGLSGFGRQPQSGVVARQRL